MILVRKDWFPNTKYFIYRLFSHNVIFIKSLLFICYYLHCPPYFSLYQYYIYIIVLSFNIMLKIEFRISSQFSVDIVKGKCAQCWVAAYIWRIVWSYNKMTVSDFINAVMSPAATWRQCLFTFGSFTFWARFHSEDICIFIFIHNQLTSFSFLATLSPTSYHSSSTTSILWCKSLQRSCLNKTRVEDAIFSDQNTTVN